MSRRESLVGGEVVAEDAAEQAEKKRKQDEQRALNADHEYGLMWNVAIASDLVFGTVLDRFPPREMALA